MCVEWKKISYFGVMAKQDNLIGTHPIPPDIIGRWLNGVNHPVTTTQCHRSLTETNTLNETELIEWLSNEIIKYHYRDNQVVRLKQKYSELGFTDYAEKIRMIPNTDKVRKGNMTEIILSEYIISSTNKPMIKTFRFRYSTNVDQSMKGDDMLMIDYDNTASDIEVYLGEAKFRQTPSPQVVRDVANALSKDTKPLSYTFLIETLIDEKATNALGIELDGFILETIKNQGKITYTGLVLSNTNTSATVQAHLNSDNPKLVFLSLGIDLSLIHI